MRRYLDVCGAAVLSLVLLTAGVRAGMGPCRKVADGGMMCGEGRNSALVLKGTT